MRLDFNNISKKFKDNTVLSNASFYINDNEIVSIVGPSGVGKSTITRIICGTIIPDSGEVLLDGNRLIDRTQIQLIPQQPFSAFDPKQTVIDSVMEPLLFHHICNDKESAFKEAKSLLNKMLIEEELFYRRSNELSGGQAQRVLIARSLTVSPKILTADEATSMLDATSQNEIIALFKNLVSNDGISILFISHDEDLVRTISNRIYSIEYGILKESKL